MPKGLTCGEYMDNVGDPIRPGAPEKSARESAASFTKAFDQIGMDFQIMRSRERLRGGAPFVSKILDPQVDCDLAEHAHSAIEVRNVPDQGPEIFTAMLAQQMRGETLIRYASNNAL